MDRVSETQLQVSENPNLIIRRLKVKASHIFKVIVTLGDNKSHLFKIVQGIFIKIRQNLKLRKVVSGYSDQPLQVGETQTLI